MRKKSSLAALLLLSVLILGGCQKMMPEERISREAEPGPEAAELPASGTQEETQTEAAQTEAAVMEETDSEETDPAAFLWTEPIPEGYLLPTEGGGAVERVDYLSRNYAGDLSEVEKHCFVYLPAGYDENREKPYDIAYIMHGFFGSAEELFTFMDGQAKNMFDHMILEKELPPMLIVAPCFDISGVATDWEFSEKELRVFSEELKNDLLPVVEGKYHTYAPAPDPEGFQNSRDHRAFGGFSMGSVCTWYQFVQSCDVIRYFLPMSGACWEYGDQAHFDAKKTGEYLASAAEKNREAGLTWLICATTGTTDYMEESVDAQITEMRTGDGGFSDSDLKYFKKEKGEHFFTAYIEYLYNILPLFFHEQEVS